MKPEAEARDNSVLFEGHLMTRPRRLTRREWITFWNRAMGTDDELIHDQFKRGYDQGYQDGEEDSSR